jgi:flagellar hook assembly protein FlgD
LALGQNAPNPFNPYTRIAFSVPTAGHILVEVFDIAGRRVRTLVDTPMPAGTSATSWDGRDDVDMPVAGGVYFCRIRHGNHSLTRKMVLLK